MPDPPQVIPATPAALEKVLRRRPVLWVGAGVSIAAGYPSTGALVDALIADADDPIDPDLPFERVADAYVASQGAGALEDPASLVPATGVGTVHEVPASAGFGSRQVKLARAGNATLRQ